MRTLFIFFLLIVFIGCKSDENIKKKFLKKVDVELSKNLVFQYPADSTVFPPEFPPPTIMWKDLNKKSKRWLISIQIKQNENLHSEILNTNSWKPGIDLWEKIKINSKSRSAEITVIGINPDKNDEILSHGKINITTSQDSVGAPIFFRAVPLPFSFATSHLDSIKYMLGDISSTEKPKVLLENLPVCGNCHSFSPDGKKFAMDVDAFGDKGSYLISDVEKEVKMTPEKFISWSDFQKKSTMALLSQISPNGKYVLSTLDDNEIFESRDELEYSQLFFPIKGILTTYDINNKRYSALTGADDTTYVHSNSSWTPDSKHVYFARARAVQRKASGMTYGTGISDLNKFQALRDSFLCGDKEFKFNLMKIPFNNGKGGQPVAIKGASKNNKSNYFPKVSPDGKWLVFCKANNYMLLQPDSKLYIMPTDGSAKPRLMNCNTDNMNSWHSWSPNGKWLVFSSKAMGAYTQLFLTHIDEEGNDSPPVWLEYLNVDKRAANIPEFVNTQYSQFDKIIDKFSDVADYNVRGTSKAQFGDFKGAIVDFNKALQVNKNDHQAFANRGKAKDELGDLKEALKDLTKAISLNPEVHDYYIHRGNTKVKMNNLRGAIEDCNKAIKLRPNDATLYAHRAGIYQIAGNYKDALNDLTTAIGIKPDYPLFYVNKSKILVQINQVEQAVLEINRALNIEPENVRYLCLRGSYFSRIKKIQKANSDFVRAIEINPGYHETYNQLAQLNQQQNNLPESINYYTQAINFCDKKNKRELATLYNNRGVLYGQQNLFDLALNDFTSAISYRNKFVDAYSNRAFAYFNLGQYNHANFDCRHALEMNPNFRKALLIQDMLKNKASMNSN